MAIFNSYVSLPEGINKTFEFNALPCLLFVLQCSCLASQSLHKTSWTIINHNQSNVNLLKKISTSVKRGINHQFIETMSFFFIAFNTLWNIFVTIINTKIPPWLAHHHPAVVMTTSRLEPHGGTRPRFRTLFSFVDGGYNMIIWYN